MSSREMPRACKNGGKAPIHICVTKECWPEMRDVCHPDQQGLAALPRQKVRHGGVA